MDIIKTPCGEIRGVPGRASGTVAYKGIRYATAGRWEYPSQVTHWDGIYEADHYGHCSYQPRAFYNEEENLKKVFYYNEFRKGESYSYSEDCLYLNIFTPAGAKEGDRLPVIVYIHGGGFTGGCGHEKHFDEPVWPLMGVIGVTLNYRLGPMGFVCLPELKEEAGHCGNYGLFDQLCAIRWVHDNISSFGGDAENITVMGQSAGAMSVQRHCMSSLSDGLFHKAVMSSGGGMNKLLGAAPAEKQYAFWQAAMKNAGCSTLAEFHAITPEKLFAVWQETKKTVKGGGCFPCLDGIMVTADAQAMDIPYMAGGNSEDMMPPILLSMARNWCSARPKPSYCWYFDRQLPGDDNGAWHSADLWYWFGTLANCWRPMGEKDRELSHEMAVRLCAFAKSGSPNETGFANWEKAAAGEKRVFFLGEGASRMAKPPLLRLIKTMLTKTSVGESKRNGFLPGNRSFFMLRRSAGCR